MATLQILQKWISVTIAFARGPACAAVLGIAGTGSKRGQLPHESSEPDEGTVHHSP